MAVDTQCLLIKPTLSFLNTILKFFTQIEVEFPRRSHTFSRAPCTTAILTAGMKWKVGLALLNIKQLAKMGRAANVPPDWTEALTKQFEVYAL